MRRNTPCDTCGLYECECDGPIKLPWYTHPLRVVAAGAVAQTVVFLFVFGPAGMLTFASRAIFAGAFVVITLPLALMAWDDLWREDKWLKRQHDLERMRKSYRRRQGVK